MPRDPELKEFIFSLFGMTMHYKVWVGEKCSFIESNLEENGPNITHLVDIFAEVYGAEIVSIMPWRKASNEFLNGLKTFGILVVHKPLPRA